MASLLGSENVPDLSNKIGLSDNDKIRLWEEASRNLTGKNTYHVIHGGPKENASSSDRLSCVVPDNIIVVIMAPPDTVMYGNTLDDFEVAMYLKNPNWPKSVPQESIEPPKTGFELEAEDLRWTTWQGYDFPSEPDELKTFEEQLKWTEQQDAEAATFVETEGKKGILYGAQIFYPGDTIYDQELSFDKNSTNFDSYYIGEAYNKKKLIDGGEKRYKDLLWKEVVWELAQMVGFKSYKEFQDTDINDQRKGDVYEFFYQMGSGSGIEMKRGAIKSKVHQHQESLVPPVKELQEKFDKGELEFSMLPINEEFNRDIHKKLLEKTRGNEVTYDTTCQIMRLWAEQAKKAGGTVIHYLNSCSPAIVREEGRNRLTKQEEALALTGKNILRDRIFESGRNNLKYLRSRWRGHQDIPIQGDDELPRLYYGVFRYMSEERYNWYTSTMGTYFQQLKFANAIGHEGLQVLYKQAVRYDYSGMMRTKLQEAFKSAEKNHGFNSTNFTWFNANPHWLDKGTGRPTQEAPHWEEGWISDANWKGQEYFGKKTEYKKTSGVVGGSNQLAIGDIIWNGEDPNLLETWGAQSINYRRWYRVINRNNEEPIILRLRRLNSDLSVWHSPDGAVDEFDLNEEAALFNYKIYNVPDAPQARDSLQGGAETKNEDLKWEVNSYIKKREGDKDIYAKIYNADWGWIVAMPCDKEGVEDPGAHWEPDKWLEGKQEDLMMNGWRHYEIGQEGGMPRRRSRSGRPIPPKNFYDEEDTDEELPDETVRRPPHQPESDSEEEERRVANLREERRAAREAAREELGGRLGWVAGEFGYAGDPDGIQATSRACCTKCEPGWCDTIMGRCSLAQQTEIGPVKHCHACKTDDGRTWQPDRLHKKKCLKNNEAFDDNDNAKYIHYTGGGAIQSYLAGSEPQRDYTWNVAQFNGDEDDFGAAQHILELSMRYAGDWEEDEADHRREQKQRYIIDAYHHPNRTVWETLLRWMRSRPIGVEQQVQQQRQPPPPPPEGQVAMPAAGGGKRNKTQKRKRRKKKTRGRKKKKGSRKKRKRRKNRTYKKLKKRH